MENKIVGIGEIKEKKNELGLEDLFHNSVDMAKGLMENDEGFREFFVNWSEMIKEECGLRFMRDAFRTLESFMACATKYPKIFPDEIAGSLYDAFEEIGISSEVFFEMLHAMNLHDDEDFREACEVYVNAVLN